MLRDYEIVRIPMVRGTPNTNPGSTRNPTRGLMYLTRDLVTAMCDVGDFRWGGSDFGAEESGDTMHFDAGGHLVDPPASIEIPDEEETEEEE